MRTRYNPVKTGDLFKPVYYYIDDLLFVELGFAHWLQYRSLFGLTMNLDVNIGAFTANDVYGYKVTLEPGLNTIPSHYVAPSGLTDGVR